MGGAELLLMLFEIIVLFCLFGPLLFLAILLYTLQVALPIIMWVMLICNAFCLLILLLIRRAWKGSGTMDREYIRQRKNGFLRFLLMALRYILLALIIWEGIAVLLCVAYQIFKPDLVGMLLGLLGSR